MIPEGKSNMSFETLNFEIDGDIGVLTLCRPKVLNAIDIPMARELECLSADLRRRPPVRALVITGAGRAFCAGGDLSSFRQPREQMEAHSLQITGHLHAAIVNFSRMDVPTVAAVNGVAAGAGFALVCACDLAVASTSATFMAAYTLAGLSPDLGLTHFLPRLVGLSAAKSIILTNRRVQATEAERLGIVSQVVSDAEMVVAAKAICSLVLQGSSAAIGATKRLLIDTHVASLEHQLQSESELLAALSSSEAAHERCRRFVK
jgi:2-(1,2-epoxy-1,2-dihydrophenyl)acetyl-CoA isomerase